LDEKEWHNVARTLGRNSGIGVYINGTDLVTALVMAKVEPYCRDLEMQVKEVSGDSGLALITIVVRRKKKKEWI
jgi:hypothetical protein